jgi:hypothetical protein
VLAVIFVTDEDDCSVAMNMRTQNNPNSIDCTKNGMSTYNCWKNDFRCLAYNLKCNEPMTTTGAKTGCTENGNGYLESIDKYVRFFSNLRSSNKLVLAGIWTPSMLDNPNSDVTKDGKLIIDYDDQVCVPGPGITCSTEALNRGKGMKAACLNTTDANFFGQAQIRLSSFIRKFDAQSRVEQSICEPTEVRHRSRCRRRSHHQPHLGQLPQRQAQDRQQWQADLHRGSGRCQHPGGDA